MLLFNRKLRTNKIRNNSRISTAKDDDWVLIYIKGE